MGRCWLRLYDRRTIPSSRGPSAAAPKCRGGAQRIEIQLLPPFPLIAVPVQFAMMKSAKRDRELVAYLTSHGSLFGELDMVSIRRGPSTDQTGLGAYESQMLTVALSKRFTQQNNGVSRRTMAINRVE